MTLKEKYRLVMAYFLEHNPEADTELEYGNPFELLVAVILSAQCTDKRVNIIMPPLMARFPDPVSMAAAETADIYELIKSCSYPNNKAKHLSGMSKMLAGEFGGTVPSDPAQLQRLPGVGRKTANVIAAVIYSKPVMAVDTHVFRVANRIGLTDAKTPLSSELQLTKHIPEELINRAHHWLILHGRYVCRAQKPACASCGLSALCRFYRELQAR
ncbi:MAG: endonuclease III [Bacteroidales bacterium]|jgi:endonuclease-3|nr:endonuclease III [Bacteroidales bacterium]